MLFAKNMKQLSGDASRKIKEDELQSDVFKEGIAVSLVMLKRWSKILDSEFLRDSLLRRVTNWEKNIWVAAGVLLAART